MAKNAHLKLTYFNARGLAEGIRLILASQGKEFEDIRVPDPFHPEWTEDKKTKMPLHSVPVLEMDGEEFPESVAILNYLAREFGLYGKSAKDQLTIDTVVQVHRDLVKVTHTWIHCPPGQDKDEKQNSAKQESTRYLEFLEKLLEKNDNGYFVGNSVTLADIVMFDALTGFTQNTLEFSEEKYPNILRCKERVIKHWRIGQYINQRPDAEY